VTPAGEPAPKSRVPSEIPCPHSVRARPRAIMITQHRRIFRRATSRWRLPPAPWRLARRGTRLARGRVTRPPLLLHTTGERHLLSLHRRGGARSVVAPCCWRSETVGNATTRIQGNSGPWRRYRRAGLAGNHAQSCNEASSAPTILAGRPRTTGGSDRRPRDAGRKSAGRSRRLTRSCPGRQGPGARTCRGRVAARRRGGPGDTRPTARARCPPVPGVALRVRFQRRACPR